MSAETRGQPAAQVTFSVEPFSRCRQEVLAFRNANRAVTREERYLEWRYHRPCAHEPLIVWARDTENRPIGAASLIPHDYFVLDGVYPVGLLGDISVLSTHQGQGIAGRMLAFLAQHPSLKVLRASAVLPNEEAESALRRAGWHDTTTIHRYVKLLDVRALVERKLGKNIAAQIVGNGINVLIRLLSPRGAKSEFVAREGSGFDTRYDTLWQAVATNGRILANRSSAYLNWRFQQHPGVDYRLFEMTRGETLEGYIVFHSDGDMAIVDDFLVARAASAVPLFQSFFDWLLAPGGTAKVQVRANEQGFATWPWSRLGFVRRKDIQRVMALDLHRNGQSSLLLDSASWHVTPGDKDV